MARKSSITSVKYEFGGKTYTLVLYPISGDVMSVYFETSVTNVMQPHTRRVSIKGDRYYDIVRQYRKDNNIVVSAD